MDLTKQYIIQSLVSAANNLRLSSEKIETVAILKERLAASENLSEELKNFKKITQLSKLGIKLSEILTYIESGKIDFLKLSEKFKEQSYGLVKDLSNVLDILTPQSAKSLFGGKEEIPIKVDLTQIPIKGTSATFDYSINLPKRSSSDEIKEAIIMQDLENEQPFNFENFEEKVLKPVKDLDSFLNRVLKFDYTDGEIHSRIKNMRENSALSHKIGFEVLSNMHSILAKGLDLIHQKKIAPSINVIESLRACLIVIVAVVRGKEVDITNYLTKAEGFGKSISPKK
ncbi:MAG: hypothetical protein FD143_2062 [Ignavibacteria bacterium]|nr:MAG: hypothetical protein FD143_2062 [Ignavibacteria bacterium]KAF0159715.1 MAG: hypothetical protein FD188_2144 [Ignavibacteria bacterium]